MNAVFRTLVTLIVISGLMACGSIKGLVEKSEPVNDVMGTLAEAGNYRTFISAIQTAGYVDLARSSQQVTVFAPTDQAFEKLPTGLMDQLLTPLHQPKLKEFVKSHFVTGQFSSTDLKASELKIKSLNDSWLNVDTSSGIRVNDAKVIRTERKATNGIVYSVNTVLNTPQL